MHELVSVEKNNDTCDTEIAKKDSNLISETVPAITQDQSTTENESEDISTTTSNICMYIYIYMMMIYIYKQFTLTKRFFFQKFQVSSVDLKLTLHHYKYKRCL